MLPPAPRIAYGIPFPSLKERFDRLEEQLEIVTGLWTTPEGERFSFAGEHYRIDDSPALPKPQQTPRPPIIIGGSGSTRTPRLAARYADEFNALFPTLDEFKPRIDNVAAACETAGRDPATMVWSTSLVLCVGRDEAELARRAAAIGRDPQELRAGGAAGTVPEVVDRLAAFVEAGAQRIYLQVFDLADLDQLRLVAAEVAPALA